MKKVLIITCYFPPSRGIAWIRPRGLAKYLPEFGWEPVILTPALPGKPDQRFRVIETSYSDNVIMQLKKKLGLNPTKRFQEVIRIPFALREGRRTFTNRLESFVKGIILYPNKKRGWCPHAIRAGSELLQKEKIDAIISSSPPETTHLVAKELKVSFNIPWIVDFRDLWTQFHYYRYSSVRKWFERRLEIKTLSHADALVTVSKPLVEKLSVIHKKASIFEIHNGFDPEEVTSASLTKDFTITYTGRVYRDKQQTGPLFQALRELIDEGSVDPAVVKISFFGPLRYCIEQEVKQYRLETVVCQHEMVPREVALERQRQSQLLLLLNWDNPREKGVYTGKLFEYLAAKRPILAVGGPKGVVSDLLEETGAGVHTSELDTLKSILIRYYREYMQTGLVQYHGDWQQVNKYSHPEMAKKFAEVLDSII
jgi:hypothetical protein